MAEEQPSQHRLKPRGPPIGGGINAAGAAAGPVAAPAHPVALVVTEQGLEPLKGPGLGDGPHTGHHRLMQILRPGRLVAVAQPLALLWLLSWLHRLALAQ